MRSPVVWLFIAVVSIGPARAAEEPLDQLPEPTPGKAWKLIWSDAFDGLSLDAAKWNVQNQRRRDHRWSPAAVALSGRGYVSISTLKTGTQYLSGCIRTKEKFERTGGYYVARINLHREPGHWPAFWLYSPGVHTVGNEGRDGTEIDIMEKPWTDDSLQHALHWDNDGKSLKSERKRIVVPGITQGWHTFAVWWKADAYIFYVDGKETWRTDAGGVSRAPAYIKLSAEIGKWAGDIRKATLPDRFLVDYVRVYDLVDEASD